LFTLKSSDGFKAEVPLTKTTFRFAGLNCFENGTQLLVKESWWRTRRTITTLLTQDEKAETYSSAVLFDRSYEDRYSDPGSPVEGSSHFGPHCYCPFVYNNPDMGGPCIFLKGQVRQLKNKSCLPVPPVAFLLPLLPEVGRSKLD
jgi:hypothetical protein